MTVLLTDCERCDWHAQALKPGVKKNEVYHFLALCFDVDKARAICEEDDEREFYVMHPNAIRANMAHTRLDSEHVWHVTGDHFGIMAHILLPSNTNRLVLVSHGLILIDGHHTGQRTLLDGRAFRTYKLTEEESLSCLIRAPFALAGPRRARLPS